MAKLVVALALVCLQCALATPPDPNNCGKPKIQPNLSGRSDRIVGGVEAKKYSWPWQVQIRYNGKHFCGASILSPDWILSAAHCFDGFSPSGYSFRVGRHSRDNAEASEQSSNHKNIYSHESYSSFTLNNDIAVIRLAKPIKFTDQASPICLPTKGELAAGTTTYVTGWGNTQNTGSSAVLRQVNVPIISRSTCNQKDYYNNGITSGMICAGYERGGKDACQGDSGGPLVSKIGTQWEQYGVVSWGSGCAKPKKPGVYSNVVGYKSWILKKVTQVEEEERLVESKFQPRPFGSAFREQVQELVQSGEVDETKLPLGGAWLRQDE